MSDTTHHIGFLRGNPFTSAHAAFAEHIKTEADKQGAGHTVILTRSHDAKKNPLSPEQKLKHAKRAAPDVNFTVASKDAPTLLHHASNIYKKGAKNLVVHASSDRVGEFHKLLHTYNGKEGKHGKYKFNKIEVKQFGGERTDTGKGMEGVSGTKMRNFAKSGTEKDKKSFFKMAPPKMSDEHKHEMWNDTRKGMQMESVTPVGIFLLGAPGSGKDYVLKNIFSRFDLTEVQADQILSGAASELYEGKQNIVINGALDESKIAIIQSMLEGYDFDYVYTSVTNKVSRLRNSLREQPLSENKRIEKFLAAEKLADQYDHFNFNNSINLNESSEFEKVFFAAQIEKLLERVVGLGLEMKESPEPKAFTLIREKAFPPVRHHKSGLPSKYVKGLTPAEIAAKKSHIKGNEKLSDRNPEAYKDMPGDKRIREKGIPLSKYTKKYHAMYGEAANPAQQAAIAINMKKKGIKPKNEETEPAGQKAHLTIDQIANKHGVSPAEILKQFQMGQKVEHEHTKDPDLAADIALNHLGEIPDYYTRLDKMEKQGKAAVKEQVSDEIVKHQEKEEQKRRIRDTRVLHHHNRHIRQAATNEAIRHVARSGGITAVTKKRELNDAERAGYERAKIMNNTPKVQEEVIDEGAADTSLAAKAKKSGVSLGTLRKVYNRGVAAWNSGHRPGTTPAQWGHARVNSYITKGKTYHTADKDLREEEDINALFEMQLIGTDSYRKHAIAMTPGQSQDIDNALPVKDFSKKDIKAESEHDCGCADDCDCKSTNESMVRADRSDIRESEQVDVEPKLITKRKKSVVNPPQGYNYTLHGLALPPRFSAFEATVHPAEQPTMPKQQPSWVEKKTFKKFGRGLKTAVAAHEEKIPTLEEAVQYHLDNNISITENVFRPGSDMFFELIGEAKRLYAEGKYIPKNEWEKELIESDIGEIAEYEGQLVVLDFPIEDKLEEACWSGYVQKGLKKKGDRMVPNCVNEEDKTEGKGIGKPWRSNGGGAVYVRTGDGGVKKVNFSQSGMTKKFMDPGATRSFIARHHCLTNKDKTSASYWACRYPRFFSNSGKIWW